MSDRRIVLLLALLLFAAASAPAQDPSANAVVPSTLLAVPVTRPSAAVEVLDARLYDYQVFELPLAKIARKVNSGGRLSLHLGGRTLDLQLEPNDVRGKGYRLVVIGDDGLPVVTEPPPPATYRGEVVGDPDSLVRLSVRRDRFSGYVYTADEWLHIGALPGSDPRAPASKVVVYRAADRRPMPGPECGAVLGEDGHTPGLGVRRLSPLPLPHEKAPAPQWATVEMAHEVDGDYVDYWGGVTFALWQIEALINNVDGIYERDIGINVKVVFQQLWTNPATDPYVATSVNERLNEFQAYWNANRTWVRRDAAMMLSARLSGGGGKAYFGKACQKSQAYGLAVEQLDVFWDIIIYAHELGHLLKAGHDDETPICAGYSCNGEGPIMCKDVQSFHFSVDTIGFSGCSLADIFNFVFQEADCF